MPYAIKTIFYTIQGEGINAGRAAVFIRFAGCNLWSGREEDRQKSICTFCDTDFVGTDGPGGGHYATADDLARTVAEYWPNSSIPSKPFVVCTGGEPLLQIDTSLVHAVHNAGFEIAVETNGTQLPPDGIDWICMSPKTGAPLRLNSGNEFKLVFPQQGVDPEQFADLNFQHFLLQPMDGPEREANTRLALEYCLAHPRWRLGLQAHKFLGIP